MKYQKKKIMGINVLSLFDGISCGQIALERARIKVNKYYASEIDKHCIKITQKNYPTTIQLGDVRKISGNNLPKIDLLIGGSPCTGFSFNGKQLNFNDKQSKLFFEYVRILKEIKPKHFLLENVKMKQEYQDVISECLSVKPIEINSSSLSGQNRKRLYWTNIQGIKQPRDLNILLKDILSEEKKTKVTETNYNDYLMKDGITKRVEVLQDNYGFHKTGIVSPVSEIINDTPSNLSRQNDRLYNINKKSPCLTCTIKEIKIDNGSKELKKWTILTPMEWERLQTIPDNYTKGISMNQRYKGIGNSWTVDVITHIFKEMFK